MIQVLEDMLRSCLLEFGLNWEKHLPLVEFAYNNSHHSSLGMSPFEALYGKRCRSPTYWMELGERKMIGFDLVQEIKEKFSIIRTHLKVIQDQQKAYTDLKRKEISFEVADKVFWKVSP